MAANQLSHFKRLFIVSGTFVVLAAGLVVGYSNCAPAMNTMGQASTVSPNPYVWRPNRLVYFSVNADRGSGNMVTQYPSVVVWCDPTNNPGDCQGLPSGDNYPAGLNYSADTISKLKSGAIGLSDLQNLPNWYPQLLLLNGDTANPGSYAIYVESNTFSIDPTLNLAQSQNMKRGWTSSIGTNGTLLAVTQPGLADKINLGLTFSATPTGFMPQRSVTQFSDGSSNYFSGEALRIYLAQHGISYGGNSTGDFNFSQSNFGIIPTTYNSVRDVAQENITGIPQHVWYCSTFFITKPGDTNCKPANQLPSGTPAPQGVALKGVSSWYGIGNNPVKLNIGDIGVATAGVPSNYAYGCFVPNSGMPSPYLPGRSDGGDPIQNAITNNLGAANPNTNWVTDQYPGARPWVRPVTDTAVPHWMTFCYRTNQ